MRIKPLLPLRSAKPEGAMSDSATGSRLASGLTSLIGELPPDPIDHRLSQDPADIRVAMRTLSHEFKAQIEDIKARWPNEQDDRADAYEGLVALFEKMAKGLADLADALDAAVDSGTDGKPEPVFLGKAGEIARGLQRVLVKWLDQSDTMVIERPLRITLYSLAIAFLNSIGADSAAAIAGLTAIVLNKDAPSSGGGRRKTIKSKARDVRR
jgi:hypothetical protein